MTTKLKCAYAVAVLAVLTGLTALVFLYMAVWATDHNDRWLITATITGAVAVVLGMSVAEIVT